MTGVDPKGLQAATKTWFGAQFDNFSGEHLRKVRNRMRGAITAYLAVAALTPQRPLFASQPLPETEEKASAPDSVKPCGIASPSYHDCPNMKEVGGGMEGERYRCAVCGKGYFLDYEDMK